MTDHENLVRRHIANVNEPDAAKRAATIAELWATDAVYRNADQEFHGRNGIEDAITQAHEAFVAPGYTFEVTKVDINHDAVRYVWEMRPAAGGDVASIGTHVATIADGRIASDHQFIDMAPAA